MHPTKMTIVTPKVNHSTMHSLVRKSNTMSKWYMQIDVFPIFHSTSQGICTMGLLSLVLIAFRNASSFKQCKEVTNHTHETFIITFIILKCTIENQNSTICSMDMFKRIISYNSLYKIIFFSSKHCWCAHVEIITHPS
jgi:hypothetical protein